MPTDLEIENARLKGRLEAQEEAAHSYPDHSTVDTSRKYLGWITTVITIIAVVISLGINWGVTKSELTSLQTQITKSEEQAAKKETLDRMEKSKITQDVMELKMKGAADEQWRTSTTESLKKINTAVERLVQRGR